MDRQGRISGGVFWAFVLGLALTGVAVLNAGPLFYVDTGGYLAQGAKVLARLMPDMVSGGMAGPASEMASETGSGGIPGGVTGNRAVIYALILGAWVRIFGVATGFMPQVLICGLVLWLVARVMGRRTGQKMGAATPALRIAALSALAGLLGALPFYSVYLMPDIFAPLLILLAGLVTARAGVLRWWEAVLIAGLMALAAMTHISHLALALALIPVSGVLGVLRWGDDGQPRRWWLAPVLIGLAAGGALVERVAFRITVAVVEQSEVVYQPFLTARLIVDGPGMAYLTDVCPAANAATVESGANAATVESGANAATVEPGAGEPACALYPLITAPEYPLRRTATHIIFETSQERGSLRLLPPEIQRAIAADQRGFALRVARSRPLALTAAILGNTWRQARRVSVRQTLPRPEDLMLLAVVAGEGDGIGEAGATGHTGMTGALARTRVVTIPADAHQMMTDWLNLGHRVIYGAAALFLVVVVLAPGSLPQVRVLVLMVLAGIAANAVICGGLSQPADRYGARAAALLPVAAALVLSLGWSFRRRETLPDLQGPSPQHGLG